MNRLGIVLILSTGLLALGYFLYPTTSSKSVSDDTAAREGVSVIELEESTTFVTVSGNEDIIWIDDITPGTEIESPLVITGKARGYWFFEASFPVILTKWDGEMIAQGIATAEGDWMTEDYVPFTVTIEFASPYSLNSPDFEKYGELIFEKQNASGLPENSDSLVVPIAFTPKN